MLCHFLRKEGPGVNVLKPNLRIAIQTYDLLDAGKAQREIERLLGVDRKAIRCIERGAKSPHPGHRRESR